jgi:hypothetical protein
VGINACYDEWHRKLQVVEIKLAALVIILFMTSVVWSVSRKLEIKMFSEIFDE